MALAALAIAPLRASTPGPFIIFFIGGETEIASGVPGLLPSARAVLDNLIASFRADWGNNDFVVMITGHTDRAGSDAANMLLSRRRAEAVRDYLVSGGIARESLFIHACGERRPLVQTADGAGEQQNRRVEMLVTRAPYSEHLCEPGR